VSLSSPRWRFYDWRESAEAGGLASYEQSHTEPYRLAGIYAGRILKGAKPADLPHPVHEVRTRDLPEDRQAHRARVPPMLLARADKVIE
jgi:hypothetical protein